VKRGSDRGDNTEGGGRVGKGEQGGRKRPHQGFSSAHILRYPGPAGAVRLLYHMHFPLDRREIDYSWAPPGSCTRCVTPPAVIP
jgi:hypothetical protein